MKNLYHLPHRTSRSKKISSPEVVLCSWQPLDEGTAKYIFTVCFEGKMLKGIRMGITIFKIFIWGGISSDLRLEITFYGSA